MWIETQKNTLVNVSRVSEIYTQTFDDGSVSVFAVGIVDESYWKLYTGNESECKEYLQEIMSLLAERTGLIRKK